MEMSNRNPPLPALLPVRGLPVVSIDRLSLSSCRFGFLPSTNTPPLMMCVLAVGLAVGTICPVACSTPLQGTCASRPRESTGTTAVVDAARTEGKNAAGKPLGRRREWQHQHQHQHQDGLPQHQGEGQARSWLFSPCLDGGVATLVLAAALLCRLGDYAQASCSCGNCGIDISCYRIFRPTIADAQQVLVAMFSQRSVR